MTVVLAAPVLLIPAEAAACTSAASHECRVVAYYECRGDGERVLWCETRHTDWMWEKTRLRCRDCGGSQAHWRVTPYGGAS